MITPKHAKVQRISSLLMPDKAPVPITRVSTRVFKVIPGPSRDMPRAMFALTSSWFRELSAYCANVAAFVRSIRSRKKNKASLKEQ